MGGVILLLFIELSKIFKYIAIIIAYKYFVILKLKIMKKLTLNSLHLDKGYLLSVEEKKTIMGGNYCGGSWIECPGSYPGHCVMDESECWDSYPPPPPGNNGGGNTDPKCEGGGAGYPDGC